jgi:drug/metabolite transporter superfamily protein YnfA
MKWFDFTVLGIMLVIIIVQTIRGGKGMGLILLEAIGLLGCAKLATSVYESASRAIAISPQLAFAGIFVLSAIIWLIIASILHNYTQWSWGGFDFFFSFIFGVVCAWTVGHMFLRFLIILYGPNSVPASSIMESPVTKEILYFKTFTALFNLLNRARLAPEPITPEKVLERGQ